MKMLRLGKYSTSMYSKISLNRVDIDTHVYTHTDIFTPILASSSHPPVLSTHSPDSSHDQGAAAGSVLLPTQDRPAAERGQGEGGGDAGVSDALARFGPAAAR